MQKKIHTCTWCGKNLSNYFSIWRHKKICNVDSNKLSRIADTCDRRAGSKRSMEFVKFSNDNSKTGKVGSGIIVNYTPGAANRSKIIDQEATSSIADNDVANCFEMDPDYTDEEANSSEAEDEETNSSEADGDEEDNDEMINYWAWERIAILCFRQKLRPLVTLQECIKMYIESKCDPLFSDIINYALAIALQRTPLHDGIDYSLSKHKESITLAVNNCNKRSIWCNIGELRGKFNCQWLSGEVCHCRDCDGTNILYTARVLTRLFIAMRADKLIRQIEEDVLKMNGKLDRAVVEWLRNIKKISL